jgi:hypothetical protein
MFLIIFILFRVQDKPLTTWHFSIQPNSLISILTTVGKSAMLVAVAESIGQLKWLHFSGRPLTLDRFQQFDEASRGPWGSAVLLWGIKGRSVLASIGAFVTIVGLGIEPSAQQILDFPTRLTTLSGSAASVGIADIYWSKAFVQAGVANIVATNKDLLRLQTGIINGIVSQVSSPAFDRHATNCSFGKFTTLGVCNTCEDLTPSITYNCSRWCPECSTFLCDYHSPRFASIIWARESYVDSNSSNIQMAYNARAVPHTNESTTFATFITDNGQGMISVRVLSPGIDKTENMTANAPPVQVQHCSWGWCARTYESVTASPGGIQNGNYTSEFLVHKGLYKPPGHSPDIQAWVSDSTGKVFQIQANTDYNMWLILSRILSVTVRTQSSTTSSISDNTLDFGGALSQGDTSVIMSDITDTLTAQIRSQALDNPNATQFPGTAQFSETYVKVRWPWLILPLVETLLASLLLITSIVIGAGQPLWKNSVTATLFHGLEGWSDQDLVVPKYESSGSLDRMAKGMDVELARNGEGVLKLIRVS